eukprot:CAMPEP_0117649558 /NCGR_PEP_ID=MMETSP0804-20121206/1040_1 /TAXON_ID=1074897 /ORGANISM="Tetraselmis astigmatica, Strain CCMP880" /LENGTH=214 /DNA_ID=CAMNT_0005455311 /DNA_START=15 /DNA_END=661 /DNA_ORIENTATION=-
MPPATATFSDSMLPGIGRETGVQASMAAWESPWPSFLAQGIHPACPLLGCCQEGCSSAQTLHLGRAQQVKLSRPDYLFQSSQVPEARGVLKHAPRLDRSTLSLKGSQQPGRRNTASHPKAMEVRSSVPMLPGVLQGLQDKQALERQARVKQVVTSGISISATAWTPETDSRPVNFFITCSVTLSVLSAGIPGRDAYKKEGADVHGPVRVWPCDL